MLSGAGLAILRRIQRTRKRMTGLLHINGISTLTSPFCKGLKCPQILARLQRGAQFTGQELMVSPVRHFPVTHLNSLFFHAECNFVETLWMTVLLSCTGTGGRTIRAPDFLYFLILLLPCFSASCLCYLLLCKNQQWVVLHHNTGFQHKQWFCNSFECLKTLGNTEIVYFSFWFPSLIC